MQWFTMSWPIVVYIPASAAIFTFVPTPSVEPTRTGFFILKSSSVPKRPPKVPTSERTDLLKVDLTAALIKRTASFPFDRMLVETDAPYLAPMPYRGKRNEPGYTRYVVETIAKERGLAWEEVAHQTTQNAIKLFRMEERGLL